MCACSSLESHLRRKQQQQRKSSILNVHIGRCPQFAADSARLNTHQVVAGLVFRAVHERDARVLSFRSNQVANDSVWGDFLDCVNVVDSIPLSGSILACVGHDRLHSARMHRHKVSEVAHFPIDRHPAVLLRSVLFNLLHDVRISHLHGISRQEEWS